jgi:hypothetical protein
MVARQPIHPDFIEKGFSEHCESSKLEIVFHWSGSSLVGRQAMKIEFARNKLSRDISMREIRFAVQWMKGTRYQRFRLNLLLKSKK